MLADTHTLDKMFVKRMRLYDANMCSVETQHTIGYGGRQTSEECPEAIAVMSFQVKSLSTLMYKENC